MVLRALRDCHNIKENSIIAKYELLTSSNPGAPNPSLRINGIYYSLQWFEEIDLTDSEYETIALLYG